MRWNHSSSFVPLLSIFSPRWPKMDPRQVGKATVTANHRREPTPRVCVGVCVCETCMSADVHPGETAMQRPRKMEFMATLGGKLIFTQPEQKQGFSELHRLSPRLVSLQASPHQPPFYTAMLFMRLISFWIARDPRNY